MDIEYLTLSMSDLSLLFVCVSHFTGGLAGSRRKGFETVQYEERLSLSNISAGWTSVKISKAFGSGVLGTATRIVSAGGLERRDFAITGAVTCQYLRQDGQFANGVLPSLATKRSTPCLVEFKGSLYCIGGCLDKAGFCGVVEELVLEWNSCVQHHLAMRSVKTDFLCASGHDSYLELFLTTCKYKYLDVL